MPLCDVIATQKVEYVECYLQTFDNHLLLVPLDYETYGRYSKKKGITHKCYVRRFHMGYTILHYAICIGCDAKIIDFLLACNWLLLTKNIGDNIMRGNYDPYHLTIHQEHEERVAILKTLLKHEKKIQRKMQLFIHGFTHILTDINHIIIDYIINSTRIPVSNSKYGLICCKGLTPVQIVVNLSNGGFGGIDKNLMKMSALLLPYDWNESIHQPCIYDNDSFKGNVIHAAIWNGGHFEIIKALVKKEPQILKQRIKDRESKFHDFSPLHLAVYKNHIDIVKYFLSYDDEEKSLANAEIKITLKTGMTITLSR
ncbi:MAG: ankyrin repeat domain-containing protein [Bacteroidota bacterium]